MRTFPFLIAALLLLPLGAAGPLAEDDDAGSGKDAPDGFEATLPLPTGVVVTGRLNGYPFDTNDIYALAVRAGQIVEARASGAHGCLYLHDETTAQVGSTCPYAGVELAIVRATVARDATWFVRYAGIETQPYALSVGIDADAPSPDAAVEVFTAPRWIQPGEQVFTPRGSCTLNFAYDGTGPKAGKVYIGTAAHCFTELGQRTWTSAAGVFGRVVYLGDYGGVNTGSFSNGIPGTQTDFALIEVDPAYHAWVRGEVRGHPGLPTGPLPVSELRAGDRIDFSGYGTGVSATKPTREERSGVFTLRSGNDWLGMGPIAPGDSGGPVLHASGNALGVADYIGATGIGGALLEPSLRQAADGGHPVVLRPA